MTFRALVRMTVLGLALVVSSRPVAAVAPPTERSARDTSWAFRFEKHGFSLRLPSSDWKKTSRKGRTDFYSHWLGSPMLFGVFSVRKQALEEFRETVKAARTTAGKQDDLLSRPAFHEEETASGGRRAHLTYYQKDTGGNQYLFVAQSFVWIKDKGLTVHSIFEGQGKMKSKAFQAREKAAFEKAARAIHRSVK